MPSTPNHLANTPDVCRNCGASLVGPYCAQCGQEDRERIVPFRRFAAEQLRDFFSLDTRFFHTLTWLLRRPGFLTNEYVAGRRARYTSPLRLYLIVSFLFFFTLTLLQVDVSGIVVTSPNGQATPADSVATTATRADTAQVARPDSTAVIASDEGQESAYQRSWLKRRFMEGVQRMQEDEAAFEEDLVSRIPSMMFFLLPIFALVLKLLYMRRGILYARHFIFSLHTHVVAFLVFLFLLLLAEAGVPGLMHRATGIAPDLLPLPFILGLWAYLFLAMHRVYEQSWLKTLVKLLLLTLIYMILFLLMFVVTAFITLLLF